MKRTYFIVLLLSLCSLVSRAQDSPFEKLSEMKGVTYVYVSKAMLKLMPNGVDTDGVDVGSVAHKLESILILTGDEPDVIARMRKETAFLTPKNGYEELMKTKDDDTRVTIFMKKKKGGLTEYVLRTEEGDDQFTLIVVTGRLTPEEVQRMKKEDGRLVITMFTP